MTQTSRAALPAHVPAALVVDFDYFADTQMKTDPRGAYLRLHGGPDIVYTPRNEGHWIATRADVMNEILLTPELFSSFPLLIPKSVSSPEPRPFAEMNQPDHMKYRRLLAPVAGANAAAAFETYARELMSELAEAIQPAGACDFARDIAQKLPIFVIMRWLNLPFEDRFTLMRWADEVITHPDPAVRRAARHNTELYVAGVLAQRRAQPGDDLISYIVNAKVDERPVTDAEAMAMVTNLVHGGLDTVRSAMAFFALFLAENPAHRRQLVDEPALIPNAVEELFRWCSIPSIARCLTRDTIFRGIEMKQGEQILMPFVLAGLDDKVTDFPLTVDFTRQNIRHMAFGGGRHFCPGAQLARIELRIFLEEWLRRIPDFALAPGQRPAAVGGVVMGINYLPLVWPTEPNV